MILTVLVHEYRGIHRLGPLEPAVRTGAARASAVSLEGRSPMRATARLVAAMALLAALAASGADAPAAVAASCLYLPPWLEDRVVYYQPFEGDPKTPVINRIEAVTTVSRGTQVPGLAGRGLQDAAPANSAGPIALRSPALSPDRPLTLSFWWRLDAPMAAETCFHLLTLHGERGIISNFVRGKGEWCALTEPRFVFQVVYYEGIPDINGIWDGSAWVEAGIWHHVAMVCRNATEIDVFWDGVRRSHHTIKGRPFTAADGGALEIGPNWLFHPMTLDEVMVVDRALSGTEIAAYVLAVQRLREVALPVLGRSE